MGKKRFLCRMVAARIKPSSFRFLKQLARQQEVSVSEAVRMLIESEEAKAAGSR